ncbi:hypothetical protein BS78_07G223300 [Paspalum vaginatum]|nr:hypothetical protein BS78_07G223300 [Paspalum vaginatum]
MPAFAAYTPNCSERGQGCEWRPAQQMGSEGDLSTSGSLQRDSAAAGSASRQPAHGGGTAGAGGKVAQFLVMRRLYPCLLLFANSRWLEFSLIRSVVCQILSLCILAARSS